MATHDYVIDNSTGANVRSDINNVLQAILTNNSSSSAPTTTAAYMWWADTTTGILKIRNSANDGWVELLQLDGTLTLEDGSASTPALAFRDDLNTGIFSSAADTFNVATAGVERMELGATTIFNEDGADVDFRIESDANTHIFYIDAGNSYVGIGHSSPGQLLSLKAASGQCQQSLTSATDQSCAIYFGDTDSVNRSTITHDNANDSLAFGTAAGERMRIDSSGRLLIGTTSGSHTLTVSGDIATSGDILLTVDDEKIQLGASQDFLLFHNSDQNYVYGVGNHPMLFFSNNVERMRLHGNTHQLQIGGSTLINSDPYLTLGQSANSQGNVMHLVNNGTADLKASFVSANKTSRAIGIDVSADTFNIFRDNSDIDFLITNSGNIGMVTSGTYSALAQITIQHDGSRFGMCIHNTNGGGGVQTCMRIRRNDSDVGSITTSGTNTQFNTSSDYRLKENETAISDGIARIKQLLPKRFNWISDETNTMQDGFFAHEVSNVVPEAITGTKDEVATEDEEYNGIKKGDPIYQQIDQSKLVPLLVAAVQELITKVETLEAA